MGGLFSSEEPRLGRTQTSYYQEPVIPTRQQVNRAPYSFDEDRFARQFQSLRTGDYRQQPTRQVNPPERGSTSQPRREILRSYRQEVDYSFDAHLAPIFQSGGHVELRQAQPPERVRRNTSILNIENDDYFNPYQVVTFIPISEFDTEFQPIRRQITNKRNFKIDSVQRIENPYLKMAYKLKKEQKEREYPYVEERWLFHGTKQANVDEICKHNFDWRRCKAHKYGKGVSFSPNSTYASNYSDEHSYSKVMIVAKVMIGGTCFGHENMVLPVDGCDTSKKGNDDIVLVKYEDNEFCPVYKINYHLMNPNIGKKLGKKKRNNHVGGVSGHLLFEYEY